MPIPSLAADLDAILGHVGSTVVFGDVVTSGKLRRNDQPAIDPQTGIAVGIARTTLRVRLATLPGLTEDSQLTVDDVAYVVRGIDQTQPDGSALVVLAEVTP